MCLWQGIVAFGAGGFSTASEQQFSHIPIYFSYALVYLVYPQPEMSRAAHRSALLCPTRRDLTKIAKWIPGQRRGLCWCCYFYSELSGFRTDFSDDVSKDISMCLWIRRSWLLSWCGPWGDLVQQSCGAAASQRLGAVLVEWQEGEMWLGHNTLIPFQVLLRVNAWGKRGQEREHCICCSYSSYLTCI